MSPARYGKPQNENQVRQKHEKYDSVAPNYISVFDMINTNLNVTCHQINNINEILLLMFNLQRIYL